MYYLNDKHPSYEYAVYCRVATACPYIKATFNNKKQLKAFMEDIIKWHNRYHQIYYVDNEGYKNDYNNNLNGTYYKILRRAVNDWEEVS